MKIKYILVILLFTIPVFSQEYMSTLTYTISNPLEDTQSFIDETSYLGFSLDARKFVMSNLSVGFYTGWHVMYSKTKNGIDLQNGTVSGTQYRHINSIPLMVNAHLYLGGLQCFRPYVGINAGGYLVWHHFDLGLINIIDNNFQWGAAPEAGFTVPMGSVHLNTSAKLNYGFAPGESQIYDEPKPLTYMSFHIGIAFYKR